MYHKIASLSFILLCLAGIVLGQESGSATLNGTVSDPSGGLVAGAKITATQTTTGLARSTETTSAGLFTFPALPVGVYDIVVEAKGFKQAKLAAVTIGVGAVVTLGVNLELGQTQEVVNVESAAPVVETTRSATSTAVN